MNRLFPLPFSFNTSAHRIFCWSFYSGHSLNKWPRWNGVEKERLDVRKVDLELRECPSSVLGPWRRVIVFCCMREV